MAPELMKQEPHDSKVDIWALGCVAHALISGSLPFPAREEIELKRQVTSEFPCFGGIREKLSRDSIKFIERCLNKRQENRPSAEELLNDPWLKKNDRYKPLDPEV